MAKETYSYGKRDSIHVTKEAYCDWHASGMRERQKRPIDMAKETYSYGKRDLFIWQKRPTIIGAPEVCRVGLNPYHMAKETY